MTEKTLWKHLKDHLSGHWTRIENGVGPGIPDSEGCYEGKQVWLELKIDQGGYIEFELAEHAWIFNRVMQGGRVFIVVACGKELRLIPGYFITSLFRARRAIFRRTKPALKSSEPWPGMVFDINKVDWESFNGVLFG